jgi:hypothetical protein
MWFALVPGTDGKVIELAESKTQKQQSVNRKAARA